MLQREVAELLVACLNPDDTTADQIAPDAPLYRDGLGMDSSKVLIEALEVALSIGKKYGV